MPNKIIVKGGYVLGMTTNSQNNGSKDILIEDGLIKSIDDYIPSDDTKTISAEGCIVLPGLIDSHRHLWYSALPGKMMDHALGDLYGLWGKLGTGLTAADMYSATRAGIVEALNMGITTLLDHCHAINTEAHADNAIQAHLELPGRALFAYGPSTMGKPLTADWSHARNIKDKVLKSSRHSFALAPNGPGMSGREGFENDLAAARGMGVRSTIHIASIAGGAPNDEVQCMCEWGLLGPDLHFSHCVACSQRDFAMLKENDINVTVCPMVEQFLGFGTPSLDKMHSVGLRPAVGTDAVSGSTGDLFDEARAALLVARSVAAQQIIDAGSAVSTSKQLGMTTMHALEAITSRASAAVFMSDSIGSLDIGKKADLITVSTNGLSPESDEEAAALLIGSASASHVRSVIVDGVIVKEHGKMVGLDIESIFSELAETRHALRARLQ